MNFEQSFVFGNGWVIVPKDHNTRDTFSFKHQVINDVNGNVGTTCRQRRTLLVYR